MCTSCCISIIAYHLGELGQVVQDPQALQAPKVLNLAEAMSPLGQDQIPWAKTPKFPKLEL